MAKLIIKMVIIYPYIIHTIIPLITWQDCFSHLARNVSRVENTYGRRQGANDRCSWHRTTFQVLFNLFHHQRQNRSNVGWLRLLKNVWMNQKILNLRLIVLYGNINDYAIINKIFSLKNCRYRKKTLSFLLEISPINMAMPT